jgi:ketosteroid isomerase-like protein
VTHKWDGINSIRSDDVKFDAIEMSELQVQNLGEVAVVTGKLMEKGHYKTTDLSATYRFTDVWVRRDGKWQLVTAQETLYTPTK